LKQQLNVKVKQEVLPFCCSILLQKEKNMYKVMKSFVAFSLKSYSILAVFVVLAMSRIASAAAETITVETPDIDWSSVSSTMISALTTVAVVGIGVAISIWVLMMLVRIFKKSAG
jgi:hypothetical protein